MIYVTHFLPNYMYFIKWLIGKYGLHPRVENAAM